MTLDDDIIQSVRENSRYPSYLSTGVWIDDTVWKRLTECFNILEVK